MPARAVDQRILELGTTSAFGARCFRQAGRLIVELALSNDRVTGHRCSSRGLAVPDPPQRRGVGRLGLFPAQPRRLEPGYNEIDPERRRLDLQYRDRLEYAVGRTCSVDLERGDRSRRARQVETTWLPTAEVAQTVAGEPGGDGDVDAPVGRDRDRRASLQR